MGLVAGVVDTVAGGGSLITFIALLGLGYAPVTANVSNTIGMVVPASATATYGQRGGVVLDLTVFLAACYGGYFGAGLGVILLALLTLLITDGFHRLNALKVALIGGVNACAAMICAFFAPVAWTVVLALLPGALIGGWVGARIARWLPAGPLRVLTIVAGLLVAARLILD